MKKGTLICFIGIDGSGKSTQAEKLFNYLNKKDFNVIITWSRREPLLIKPVVKFIKKYILKEKGRSDSENYIDIKKSRNKYFKHFLLRKLWINIALLDYFLKLLPKIHVSLLKGKVIICDRYVHDAIADFAASFKYNKNSVKKMLKNPLLKLFPKPTKTFYINIYPETGAERKSNGTSIEYLKDRKRIYDLLSKEMDIITIDGAIDIESVRKNILYKLNSF